jgi:hypothetical protein
LASVSTQKGAALPDQIAARLLSLLGELKAPTAFFIRLVNTDHEEFRKVENYFRYVIEPVVNAAGYRRHEVGTDAAEGEFMNVEIFEELHYSPLIIADMTALRPNCFLELGYALRGDGTVLITANEKTTPPFDTAAMPWHFWKENMDDAKRQEAFKTYWQNNGKRPPLVRTRVPF